MKKYIYQYKNWPKFTWDEKRINMLLAKVRYQQGRISGRMSSLGFSETEEAQLETLSLDVIKTSEIEGERLNYEQVRSSLARRLGIEYAGFVHSDRNVEGIVELILDASQNYKQDLTEERLFGWHAALFPTGYSGMHKVSVGKYRNGEMQIVSGAMGKEKVHFQAPSFNIIENEMRDFLSWLNHEKSETDELLRSAIAHFWFIILHPFDDGNGRLARAISDLLLARSEDSKLRFYSMSNQILKDKKQYYAILQEVQHSSGDITLWLEWFLQTLLKAMNNTEDTLNRVMLKAEFWNRNKELEINSRQRLILNKLFDGFTGKLKTSKWAKIAKCSKDTALRDIKDLMEKGILKKEDSGGRSTNYELVEDWKPR